MLSLLIFLPLLGAITILFVKDESWHKNIAAIVCVFELIVVALIYQQFQTQTAGYQLVEQANWIRMNFGSLGVVAIDYILGIDGLSMPLLMLAAVVMLVGAVASHNIAHRSKAYFSLYLVLTSSIFGCFLALDFFLFFLFFEFMLLPMYFLIGLWGGPRREYASLKFFIYTLLGSVLILIVMIGLHLAALDPIQSKTLGINVHTFDLRLLSDLRNYLTNSILTPSGEITLLGLPSRMLAFWLLFIGFAIKLPVAPLHTWLPDAHVEAPTPVSVVLAGVLLKVGGYGLMRIIVPIFPDALNEYANILGFLGVFSIVYGGFNALAQHDLKKMVAYSSVSHMGFVLLGVASLTTEGFNGAVFQMVSHGVLSAMLFLIAGVLYDRTHDRQIDNFRGLAKPMPIFTVVVGIAFFASLGLPAFSGFVGELFPLMGGFKSPVLPILLPTLATLGIVLAAAYFLWTFQKMFLGEFFIRNSAWQLPDLDSREKTLLFSLAVISLLLGIYPNIIFDLSSQTVKQFLQIFDV